MSGVSGGIAHRNRIQIDEDHAVAIQENVVGLEVAMDRRGRDFFQARNDRGSDRFDLRSDFGTSPLNQSRGPLHVIELVSERMMASDAERALTPAPSPIRWERGTPGERGDGPGD